MNFRQTLLEKVMEGYRQADRPGWAGQRSALVSRRTPKVRRSRSYPYPITQTRERARRQRQIAQGILKTAGFTALELLIVLAIMGLVVGIIALSVGAI